MKNFDERFKIKQFNENNFNFKDIICSYGEGHLVNRLYVHWDLLTKCNFNCSYCYARNHYNIHNNWQKMSNNLDIKLILEALSRAKLPVFLGLLGGEPTLHPNFKDIFEEINKKIIIKDNSRLYITSNLSNDKLLNLNYNKKIKILASLHLEHKKEYNNFKDFLKRVDYLSKLVQVRINLMLIPLEEYFEDIKHLIEKLKNMNIELHPHFIYDGTPSNNLKYNYLKLFEAIPELKNIHKEFIFETKEDIFKVSDSEIFKNKLNNFKGFKCYNNNYEISFDGYITNVCKYSRVDIKSNLNYFKKIDKINPIICPHSQCNCDGFLKIYKEK